jgi:hypothetical protein
VGEVQHAVPLEDLYDSLQGGADRPLGHVGDVDVPLQRSLGLAGAAVPRSGSGTSWHSRSGCCAASGTAACR